LTVEFVKFDKWGSPVWTHPFGAGNLKPKVWKTASGAMNCRNKRLIKIFSQELCAYCKVVETDESPNVIKMPVAYPQEEGIGYVIRKLVTKGETKVEPHFQYVQRGHAKKHPSNWRWVNHRDLAYVWKTGRGAQQYLHRFILNWYRVRKMKVNNTLCVAKAPLPKPRSRLEEVVKNHPVIPSGHFDIWVPYLMRANGRVERCPIKKQVAYDFDYEVKNKQQKDLVSYLQTRASADNTRGLLWPLRYANNDLVIFEVLDSNGKPIWPSEYPSARKYIIFVRTKPIVGDVLRRAMKKLGIPFGSSAKECTESDVV